MKNLKKLISVVLCLAMMASFLVVGTSAASYPDVDETKGYYAAVELLSALGILKGDDEGNFNPDAEIKRSEFAAVVCRALGMESAATSTVSKFDDVSSDHWAVGYIGWAAGKGIVNGYGDGTFGPDRAVTYQEAIKMVMAALGYDKLAQNNGGYPYGYLSLAGTYGVSAGLSADPTAPASRALVAQIVYNALEAPLMDTSYYSSTEERYVVYDGSRAADYEERTILSQYLDIIKVKASVAANYKTDETLWRKNAEPQVKLDLTKVYNVTDRDEYQDYLYTYNKTDKVYDLRTGVKVFEGDTAVAEYLGYELDAYLFLNEDDALELAAIITDGKSVETLDVIKKDIVTSSVTAPTASAAPWTVEFEYWEDIENDSKETEVDVANTATVYVNGKEVGPITTTGMAEFVALANSDFDVQFVGTRGEDFTKVFITKYIYRQVAKVELEDEYITFDKGGSLELSKEARRNDKFTYAIYKDGEEIALEDLQEGDILSIVAADNNLDNGAYVDIFVSSETLEGTVTGAKSGNQNKTFYIDKVEYTTVDANILTVGDTGIFRLTADGKIYSAEAVSSLSDNYGFILRVAPDNVFGENTWQIRLFTKDGSTKTLSVASTLKVTEWKQVNGIYKNDEQTYKRTNNGQDTFMNTLAGYVAAAGSENAAYLAAEKRLITFTEENGEITRLTLAATNVAKDDLRRAYDVDDFNNESYRPSSDRFAGYTYTDATKLFYTPVAEIKDAQGNLTGTWGIDEDKVALLSVSALDEEKTDYKGYVYATTADKELGAATITSNLGFAGRTSALAVVISSAEGLNAEGEKATTVTVLKGGEVITYAVDDDADNKAVVTGANTGDIIQFVVNGIDEISAAELIYTANPQGAAAYGLGNLGTYATTENGKAGTDVKYVYGIVGNIGASYVDLGSTFAPNATYTDFSFDIAEGATLARVDASKVANSPNSAVTKLSSTAGFRATRATYDSNNVATFVDQYVMVARLVDGDIVDAVAYQLGADADTAGNDLLGETYTLTYTK